MKDKPDSSIHDFTAALPFDFIFFWRIATLFSLFNAFNFESNAGSSPCYVIMLKEQSIKIARIIFFILFLLFNIVF
ncbi:hypothetical protein FFJ24_004650 [Pedobacter sp. KBS0701]|uniref:hypothetical protein n=1 Tax=Pedobacter sp. KBS0701 TaxID=2578106 RepID=UPI00110EB62C|nr:hypothetical protein [Pedobacter sp. KBS0701]QDW24151.1 hypothetical protein FFJ24_004650 [Pedobacter sp. KBS0701]